MQCQLCKHPLEAKTDRRKYCNDTCRGRAWQDERKRKLSAALAEAEMAIQKARQLLPGEILE